MTHINMVMFHWIAVEKRSPVINMYRQTQQMSDIDMDKVMSVKQKIDSGTYDLALNYGSC